MTASIKNLKETRVGDTITDAENPCAEALPGYKKVNPMVYCGLYPADGAKYPDLRDALEKLQLNDASLYYEPETSVALDLVSDAVSLAFCIWRLFRNVWKENTILILSQRRLPLFIESIRLTAR